MNHSLYEVKLMFFRLFCIYTDCMCLSLHMQSQIHIVVHVGIVITLDAKLKEKEQYIGMSI